MDDGEQVTATAVAADNRRVAERRREETQRQYEESVRAREAIRNGYPAGAPLMAGEIIGRDTVKIFNWFDLCREENERARRARDENNGRGRG